MPDNLPARVLQVHLPTPDRSLMRPVGHAAANPTLSAAVARAGLAQPPGLPEALAEAARQGYNVVEVHDSTVFGGGALAILTRARQLGMRTILVCRGHFVRDFAARVAWRDLESLVDLVLVEIDGPPDLPVQGDEVARERADCFAHSLAGMARLRDRRIAFGVSFTLTRRNLGALRWVADFCGEQSARLLRVRSSRERGLLRPGGDPGPDAFEQAMAYVELLQHAAQHADGHASTSVAIDVDLIRRDAVATDVDVFLRPETPPSANGPLAQRVSPLVIESDGCVVPWRRGFDREFAVAHLARETLGAGVERWSCQRQAGFSRLCQKVHRRLTHVTAPPFFNWHDEVCAASALAGGLIGPLAGQNVHAVSNSLSAE